MLDYRSTLSFSSETTEGVAFEIHKPSTARNIEFNRLNADFRERARSLQAKINANERKIADDARAWQRTQDARYALAKSTPETEEAQAVIAGYEADQEVVKLRNQIGNYDLQSLTDVAEDDPRVVEVRDLLATLENTARLAVSYTEPDELAEERSWLRRQTELLMDESYRPARVKWGVASLSGLTINGKPATVESQVAFGPPDLTAELFAKVEEVARFSPEKLKKSSLPITSSAPAVGSETSTIANAASTTSSTSDETATSISQS